MRRLAPVLLLLLVSPGLRADPAETPFLVLREPDPETEKEIKRDLITEKSLGGSDRRQKREELARIGPWCVPYLATALRKENARIKLNAVLTLAMIRDPRGLVALREAAAKDDSIWVRRAATLAIPLFEWRQDLKTLKDLLATPRAEWRSVAPALARLRATEAAPLLASAAERLPRDEHDAAAIVLSAAVAGADIPFVELLEDRSKLVQEAAAAGLAIRPLPPQRAGEILAARKRSRMGGEARVLAIRALGAIDPRPDDAQAALLEIASKDGEAAERIAALLELRGTADEIGPLWKAYQRLRDRNDPVLAALLLALARTREPKAEEKLLELVTTGSDFVRFYAGAALLCVYGPGRLTDDQRARIAQVEKLQDRAQGFYSEDAAVRRAALEDLKRHKDLKDKLRLLYLDRSERNWLEVNRLLTRILELGQALNQFDASGTGRTSETALDQGGAGGDGAKKAATASDEQQDLFDLLMPPNPERRAYFGPEDLARG
ncbi:MAG TPA: HEAT repeat domain-containing protein [Planctomycetota bacterium]|nr:HEAT repeat domain-containing protein [Planctomycetota bacterium]